MHFFVRSIDAGKASHTARRGFFCFRPLVFAAVAFPYGTPPADLLLNA